MSITSLSLHDLLDRLTSLKTIRNFAVLFLAFMAPS
jgi:hypothetical protein